MQIIAQGNYGLDILCFLNALAGDDFITKHHQADYDYFYPLLSDEMKYKIQNIYREVGNACFSPITTYYISAYPDFDKRDLMEMLNANDEMDNIIKSNKDNSHFVFNNFNNDIIDRIKQMIENVVIPLIIELEENGFKQHWVDKYLPGIFNKCAALNIQYNTNNEVNFKSLFEKYKPIHKDIVKVFICPLSFPYGIRLFDYSSLLCPPSTHIGLVAHEMFHCPYDINVVRSAIDKLASFSWIKEAFTVGASFGYVTMDDFIEENIVEALGTFVGYKFGVEQDPYMRFRVQNDGSNVLSPYFFKYLQEYDIQQNESFDDYFIRFTEIIEKIKEIHDVSLS